MPVQFPVTEPNNDEKTPAEYLAIRASPSVVAFAERAHQSFLESLQDQLSSAAGADTRAAFIGTEQSFLSRYLNDGEPGIHNVFLSLEPLAGCAVLRFSSELLFKVLDILLASPATVMGGRGESVTEIEFHVLRSFFKAFSETLRETWRLTPPLAFTPSSDRSGEAFLPCGESQTLALKSTIEIDGVQGEFTVVIPAFLARLSANLSAKGANETIQAGSGLNSTRSDIIQALGTAKVDVDAVLSGLTIRIGDLVELEPGQIVLADKVAGSAFDCVVNKRTLFKGEIVASGDRYGFQLTREQADDEAESATER